MIYDMILKKDIMLYGIIRFVHFSILHLYLSIVYFRIVY
jgi:hypothetical protein